MAIDTSKLRAKMQKKQEEKERKGKGDLRFLNYYDLDVGGEMRVRLVPDASMDDEIFVEYSMHGPNLKNPNIDSVRCVYESSGTKCPACKLQFDFYNDDNKDEAKRWRAKEYYLSQCIVIDSPVEVPPAEDGNLVKLFSLPFHVKEMLVDSILNGTIEDPTEVDLVIKKTKQGDFNRYDKSYFDIRNSMDVPEHVIQSLEEGTSYVYELSKQTPDIISLEDMEEWVEKAVEEETKSTRDTGRSGRGSGRVEKEESDRAVQNALKTAGEESNTVEDEPAKSDEPVSKKGSSDLSAILKRRRAG